MPSWPVRGDPAAGKMWVEVILPPFVLLTTRPVAPPPPPEGSPRLVWFKTFWNEATNKSIPSFSRCTVFCKPVLSRTYPGPWMMSRPALPKLPLAGVVNTEGSNHRSEEHTSELQSRQYLVCRLLLEK